MGSWRIEIHGHGIHDNGLPDDAEAMAGRFMKELQRAGHNDQRGTFALTSESEGQLPKDIETPRLLK